MRGSLGSFFEAYALNAEPLNKLYSKLLKGGLYRIKHGTTLGDTKGDTRSLDFGSTHPRAVGGAGFCYA